MIIGVSGKKGSGKDTFYQFLKELLPRPVYRVGFADALKVEVADICKTTVAFIEENKKQFRTMLQWWGTDFRRHYYGDDYWVAKAFRTINNEYSKNDIICMPDVRFLSEACAIIDKGGIIVRIDRPTLDKDTHSSETELDSFHNFEYEIYNNSSLEDFKEHVKVFAANQPGL